MMKSVGCCLLVVLLPAAFAWGDCDDVPDNVFFDANCSFQLDTSGWTTILGTPTWVSSDGYPELGSLEVASELTGMHAVQLSGPCRAFSGDTFATLTNYMKLMSGSSVSCSPGVALYASTDCSEPSLGGWAPSLTPGPDWTIRTNSGNMNSIFGATILSAQYRILCYTDSGPFTVRFDHAWLAYGSTVPVELSELSVE